MLLIYPCQVGPCSVLQAQGAHPKGLRTLMGEQMSTIHPTLHRPLGHCYFPLAVHMGTNVRALALVKPCYGSATEGKLSPSFNRAQ